MQEVEERLKQKVQPLAADLSLPTGLEKRMKTGQKGGGYGGSKEATGYTKVRSHLAWLACPTIHVSFSVHFCCLYSAVEASAYTWHVLRECQGPTAAQPPAILVLLCLPIMMQCLILMARTLPEASHFDNLAYHSSSGPSLDVSGFCASRCQSQPAQSDHQHILMHGGF